MSGQAPRETSASTEVVDAALHRAAHAPTTTVQGAPSHVASTELALAQEDHAQRAGRVWRLPDEVDTDQLAPGHAMKFGIEVIARHCLEAVRPEFAGQVRRGDVVVAGKNFGIGSSREQAAAALVHLGVAAVVAPSFSGLFLRNAFNVGLLLMTCPQADCIDEGETLHLDARAGTLVRSNGEVLRCTPIPGFLLDMVEAGGLLPLLKRRLLTQVQAEPQSHPHADAQAQAPTPATTEPQAPAALS